MTLNIQLDQDLEARLITAARSQGLAVEDYARDLIRQAVESNPSDSQVSKEEFRAFLDTLASKGSTSPGFGDETFSRSFIYGDHD